MAKDPVCGMFVDEKSAKFKSQAGGQTYYFCAPGCKARFDANPKQFTAPAPAKPAPAAPAKPGAPPAKPAPKPAPKKSGCS
jgi:Cu+-exporting ATPase